MIQSRFQCSAANAGPLTRVGPTERRCYTPATVASSDQRMNLTTEPYVINIGPQHPSTHGVFRMKLTMEGETITDAEMVVGYLHRSLEKLAEERSYTQNIPFTDRMDYLSAMSNNLGYCMAVEKLAGIRVPERGEYIRVIMAELQRFANHCMAVGTFINDAGAWQ